MKNPFVADKPWWSRWPCVAALSNKWTFSSAPPCLSLASLGLSMPLRCLTVSLRSPARPGHPVIQVKAITQEIQVHRGHRSLPCWTHQNKQTPPFPPPLCWTIQSVRSSPPPGSASTGSPSQHDPVFPVRPRDGREKGDGEEWQGRPAMDVVRVANGTKSEKQSFTKKLRKFWYVFKCSWYFYFYLH